MAVRRMLIIPTGTCRMAQARTRLGGSPDVEVAVPLPMFAIDTDDCWVIFDDTRSTVEIVQNTDCHPMPDEMRDRLMSALKQKMK